ncbi:MAG: hypothetical protein M0R37_12045 [Bacteroidales bacterium]|jgi:hypothetical protein|nr:hypothetical protein [Sphaerochaeta sp.]MCK9629306.1 hypothetical protein [Bacteroidales bacterium]
MFTPKQEEVIDFTAEIYKPSEKPMNEDTQIQNATAADAWEQMIAAQEAEAGPSMPTPATLKLHGNLGQFNVIRRVEKESQFSKVIGDSLKVVILAVRYLAKWKYEEKAPVSVMTREFADFNDPVTLLTIDNLNRDNEASERVYRSYADFKADVVTTDKITQKVKSPFDLYVSLYVLVPAHREVLTDKEGKEVGEAFEVPSSVMRLRVKGDGRSNFFDAKLPRAVSSVVVEVGAEKKESPQKDKDGKALTYFAATFEVVGDVPTDKRSVVLSAMGDLKAWMGFYEAKRSGAAPAIAASVARPALPPATSSDEPPLEDMEPDYTRKDEEEIKIEDIPF